MNIKPVTPKGGVWQKLLNTLSRNIGKLVLNAKLMQVSGQHNYARRVRELRAEGWDIVYSPKLGGYILRSDKKITKAVDRYINLKLRQKILERDNFICQACGHKGGKKYSDGEIVRLEVDHILPLNDKGMTVEENLRTLCSRCNAGKKSLLAYPETLKNKIVTMNLPDDIRKKLSNLALKDGRTINSLLLDAVRLGMKKLK